jgi:hypothetical protein
MSEQVTDSRRKVSYSQYAMWANCPHQWKLSYVDKLKPDESSIHLIFGTAIHDAIQKWLAVRFIDAKKASILDIKGIFKDRLMELFKEQIKTDPETSEKTYLCDKATLKEFHQQGCDILDHVKEYQNDFFPTPGYKLIGCEVPLEVPLTDHVRFVGFLDIVIAHPRTGKIFIYDLKTSKKGWFYEKKDPKKTNQLLLYKRFYSQVFDVKPENIEVKFIILKREINESSEWGAKRIVGFEPSHGTISMKKANKEFDTFINTTFGEDGKVLVENLKPTPSESACKWCLFREKKDLCPTSYSSDKK